MARWIWLIMACVSGVIFFRSLALAFKDRNKKTVKSRLYAVRGGNVSGAHTPCVGLCVIVACVRYAWPVEALNNIIVCIFVIWDTKLCDSGAINRLRWFFFFAEDMHSFILSGIDMRASLGNHQVVWAKHKFWFVQAITHSDNINEWLPGRDS